MRTRWMNDTFGDFKCIHCRQIISADAELSGVHNRNHCPYCLHSRHMDLHQSGDRLAACKGKMRPVGLTFKRAGKKYGKDQGELMLVHQCEECGKVSINRIAADDIADHIYEIFEQSVSLNKSARALIEQSGVQMAARADEKLVRARLYGWENKTGISVEPVYSYQ